MGSIPQAFGPLLLSINRFRFVYTSSTVRWTGSTIQGDDVRPLLIFGTAHKLSAREPFLTLAYHFSQRVLRTRVLAVVGYSFGDEHINQIIDQGLKKNAQLRIVVVSPQADQVVKSQRFLDRNPRVSTIVAGTKAALNERFLTDRFRDILRDVSTEEPFPERSK
jgi:hypothetical protein